MRENIFILISPLTQQCAIGIGMFIIFHSCGALRIYVIAFGSLILFARMLATLMKLYVVCHARSPAPPKHISNPRKQIKLHKLTCSYTLIFIEIVLIGKIGTEAYWINFCVCMAIFIYYEFMLA